MITFWLWTCQFSKQKETDYVIPILKPSEAGTLRVISKGEFFLQILPLFPISVCSMSRWPLPADDNYRLYVCFSMKRTCLQYQGWQGSVHHMFDSVKGKIPFVMGHRVFKAAIQGKYSPCLKAKGQACNLVRACQQKVHSLKALTVPRKQWVISHIVFPAL